MVENKNNQYQVAKIYFETLGMRKSKQGAKSKIVKFNFKKYTF
ncbi:MAG: hypothetical protein ACRDAS_04700 [Cetobacterium sp.]